jgi:hypothetical protein
VPDPGDGGEPFDAGIAAEELGQVSVGPGDLWGEQVDQAQVCLEAGLGNEAELNVLEKPASGEAEQVGHRRSDGLVGEQGVSLALQARGDPGKGDSRSGQLASVADLGRGRPGLGQQVGAQQVGERLGVDPVVLHPCRRDRLGGKGMGHVGRDADV